MVEAMQPLVEVGRALGRAAEAHLNSGRIPPLRPPPRPHHPTAPRGGLGGRRIGLREWLSAAPPIAAAPALGLWVPTAEAREALAARSKWARRREAPKMATGYPRWMGFGETRRPGRYLYRHSLTDVQCAQEPRPESNGGA